MGDYGIGQSVPREEDPYLLRGAGRYVDDVAAVGQLRGYVLRSPHAHAKIKGIDTSAAKAMPGVHLVLTGDDPELRALGAQLPQNPRKRRDGSPAKPYPQPLLARERVRYLGEPVAFIVADTLHQAKDAAEAVEIDYEPLPVLVSSEAAVAPGAPAIWEDNPGNEAFFHTVGNKSAVEDAFARATHVVRTRLDLSRMTTNSIEPRGCLAEYDAREDRYTLRCTVQGPHTVRRILAQEIFRLPEIKFRVISENVGGGFGLKGGLYPEYALATLAARLTGRPVKWIGERSESLLADEHARENITEAEMALDADGRFLAVRTRSLVNVGAYYTNDRSPGPATNNLGVLAGTYTTPALYCEVTGVLTNTMLTGPYRGSGRPEAAYVIETLVDLAARQLKIDPAELRRRNTIPADAMPFKTGLVYTYDCGDFRKNLEDCLIKADYAGFPQRRAEARKRGKLRGIGISNTVEASNAGRIEHAEIRFDPSGTVTVSVGTHDHGQGHQTSYRQIIAGRLGIDPGRIRFKWGDTDQIMIGTGTFGSRSTISAGTALVIASEKIVAKGKRIAAHLLEASEQDIVFDSGRFLVAGTDRAVDLEQVARDAFVPARLPKGLEPGLYETGTFDGGYMTYPNGCHICEVEIDEETGVVTIVRYTAVDDVGHMINPMLVEGQLHGGIAQGIGEALMERIVYDASGQLLTGSFMDYRMPRAHDFCAFDLGENEVPTKSNPLGVKGAGESGTVGALAATMNAVNDALASIGADYVPMPATPARIWTALQQARRRQSAADLVPATRFRVAVPPQQ